MRYYLDTDLYFYGSVMRSDYVPEQSDIDVAIFTDNTSSMLSKINNYFNIKKCEFKKFVWKLNITKNVVSGQKYMYTEPENNFKVEFCIYDEKFKNDLLLEYDDKIQIPFYATILLILLKVIFYKLELITREWYSYLKGKILTVLCGKPVNHFVIVDIT